LNTCDILHTFIHRDQNFLLKPLEIVMIGQRFFISRLLNSSRSTFLSH